MCEFSNGGKIARSSPPWREELSNKIIQFIVQPLTSTCLYRSCAALAYFSGHGDKRQEKLEFDLKPLILN